MITSKIVYFLLHITHSVGAFHVSRSILRSPSILFSAEKELLPSTYDVSLPAGLRGEAVRSALKSDRGVCFDFTSSSSSVKNVGVVKVSGKGTAGFLNNKLSNTFPSKIHEATSHFNPNGLEVKVERGVVIEGGLLNSKGQIIDNLNVCSFPSSDGIEAHMMTSPGHAGSQLFDRLDPFIFPLDGVKLKDMCPTEIGESSDKSQVFAFAATKIETAQNCIKESVLPVFDEWNLDTFFSFPNKHECIRYSFSEGNEQIAEVIICEEVMLPSCVSNGYTVVISDQAQNSNDRPTLGSKVWELSTSEHNFNGPVALGPLEYETLRIEGGKPGFGYEMTGHLKKTNDEGENSVKNTKASPLELDLEHIVDQEKGCYQGQEGVASLLKNKKGVPRTLYSVTFPEEDNFYEGQKDEEEYSNHSNRIPNETKIPKVGDDMYVLGSNKTIKVGTLTSVAERGGTSVPETVALALVRRSEAILNKMKKLDLEIDRDTFSEQTFDVRAYDDASGIIMPPPLDPLDGLQVLLENGMTRGLLKVTPARKLKSGQNMFEIDQWATIDDSAQNDTGSVMGFLPDSDGDQVDILNVPDINDGDDDDDDDEDIDDLNDEELSAAIEAARTASEEARRKEEKLNMLQKRAEEAVAKRKAAKEAARAERETEEQVDEADADSEAKRKAAKMEMLKKRAEEAMARRKTKKG